MAVKWSQIKFQLRDRKMMLFDPLNAHFSLFLFLFFVTKGLKSVLLDLGR